MKAEVDQPLGDIFLGDAAGLLDRTDVDDALVSHVAVAAGVQDRVVILEPVGDVVGIEDGDLGCLNQSGAAHQGDISP